MKNVKECATMDFLENIVAIGIPEFLKNKVVEVYQFRNEKGHFQEFIDRYKLVSHDDYSTKGLNPETDFMAIFDEFEDFYYEDETDNSKTPFIIKDEGRVFSKEEGHQRVVKIYTPDVSTPWAVYGEKGHAVVSYGFISEPLSKKLDEIANMAVNNKDNSPLDDSTTFFIP